MLEDPAARSIPSVAWHGGGDPLDVICEAALFDPAVTPGSLTRFVVPRRDNGSVNDDPASLHECAHEVIAWACGRPARRPQQLVRTGGFVLAPNRFHCGLDRRPRSERRCQHAAPVEATTFFNGGAGDASAL